ncbi:hypothetical protein HMI55_001162 [Coelomomyces lativittatus]|nr:hypothetical protein HMI55_001162 [Coelomomyces lativittatus]
MNVKHIVVKSKIDDLENEQGYDTLVIPSDIYQNDDSLKKFKQVYKKFWDENKMENFIKVLKSIEKDFYSTLKKTLRKLYSCLTFLNTDELKVEEDSSCTDVFYAKLDYDWSLIKKVFLARDKFENFVPSPIEIHRIQFSFLPWVILMEWVSTNRMRTPNPLGFGINEPSLFQSQYNCVYLNL